MARPCTCDRLPPAGEPYAAPYCRLCWLFRHDGRYQSLWATQTGLPLTRRESTCVHLGPVLDRLGCPCPRKWRRSCEVYQTCTLEICQHCPDYEPDE
jgi:hypothetical protein